MKHRFSKYDKIFMVMMITSIEIIGVCFLPIETIARWSFTTNNQTDSFNIDLGAGYLEKKDVYDLELSAVNSDLDVWNIYC